MITLFTERLLIRDYVIDDLNNHHKLLSDAAVMYYLPDIKTETIEQSKENLLKVINDQGSNERKLYHFVIESKNTNEFIGGIGYTVLDNTPYGKLVHVGYFILKHYWNKGYTTEALKRIIEFAFNENNVYRIHTGCLKDNVYSEKIMQKCGFIKEAEFIEYAFHDGKLKDRVEYRMLKNDLIK
ncbi:MAG: GNAT family N-acetyltransferase [Treponema sp.]|nr:GNAT family N-acetyltransferase [Treponema sp.]